MLLWLCNVARAQTPVGEWPTYGGDAGGQRYSALRQVTAANVTMLRQAWSFHTHVFDTPSPRTNWRASTETTPVLWNETLYFDTPFDAVFAIDGATGKQRWSFDPKVDRQSAIYNATSRGVALWHAKSRQEGACGGDRVFVATLDRRLIARDASSGAACLSFGQGGTVDLTKNVAIAVTTNYSFTSPPTVVGDTVVLGSLVADNQGTFEASGAVRGFSAVTGQQVWSWEPLRGMEGKQRGASGSGNAWAPISADPENDLVLVPTGSPSVDFYGGTRPGENRDANSIVALRASTGEKIWSFQLVHHDLWDYDTPSEPVLFLFRGKTPAVAVVTKTNMVYVFNRLTGEPLYPIEERPVPQSTLPGEVSSPTQPFSTLPPLAPLRFSPADLHFRDAADRRSCTERLAGLDYDGLFTPPSLRGSLVFPGSIGGANWGSAALDPQTNTLYTRVSNFPFAVQQVRRHEWPLTDTFEFLDEFRTWYLGNAPLWLGGDPKPLGTIYRTPDGGGSELEYSPQEGAPYKLWRTGLLSPSGLPCGPEPYGALVAIDLDTGRKVWSVAHGVMREGAAGSIGVGGPMVTAGGLVFAASTNDAYLRAYDVRTGREVWRQAIAVAANATPMTYAIRGRQYVVLAVGGHGFVGAGKGDEVVAFALPTAKKRARQATR